MVFVYNFSMAMIKISQSAYAHNIHQISQIVGLDKICVVLKDNAYGHGLKEIAHIASDLGITKAVVRNAEEALQIKDVFSLILALDPHNAPQNLPQNIAITANSLQDLQLFSKHKIHLKIDTGMHRNGVSKDDLQEALDLIKAQNINLCGVFSHARSCDELSSEGFWQLYNFKAMRQTIIDFCKKNNMRLPIFHFANSSTITRFKKDAAFDMVRLGIASYGYDENHPSLDKLDLRPVMSLWARSVSARKATPSMRIGYGATASTNETTISSYDIGYADGFFRLNESHNYKTPSGKRLLGRVSMDYTSFEGNEKELCIFDDVKDLAKLWGTISYDCLVKLKTHIKRQIHE